MSRQSYTRISRPLIAVLGITIAVGTGAYVHNVNKSHAKVTDREPIALKAVNPTIAESKTNARVPTANATLLPMVPTAIVTQTPSAASSAAPVANPPATATPVAQIADATPAPAPAAPQLDPHAIDDAKAKVDAGELVAGRQLLNDALASGSLSAADADIARHSLSDINQTVIFSHKRFKDDPFVLAYQVQSGERLARIADKHNVTWELLCRVNGLADPKKVRAGQWIKIPAGPFHCVISKSAYRLDVYLGSAGESRSLFVTSFLVGLGKDNSTPTGSWLIQQGSKAHPATYYSPRGEGVIAADDPKNPLGGYWMGLTGVAGNAVEKNSYGIHGTIEPDSIGKQASMGCIRLGHDDIALLYDLLVDGKSRVVVKD